MTETQTFFEEVVQTRRQQEPQEPQRQEEE